MALWPSFSYVTIWGQECYKGKQRIIGVKCNSCRIRGLKSKLSCRHAELGAVKIKKKLGMFRPAHCSVYLVCSQERVFTMILKIGMLVVFFAVMVGVGLYCRKNSVGVRKSRLPFCKNTGA